MTRLPIAVVGAGSWGRNHVRTLASLADVKLSAICDTSEQCRASMQKSYPFVRVTADFDEALDCSQAVVIATPAGAHADLALKAIERGIPILVEKPFALSVAEAEAVAELAAKNDVPVVVGHLLLFHPAIAKLKQLIDAGDVGDILYLYSQRVNLGQVRPDENALWSFGPHDVSVALDLLGTEPLRVRALGKSYLQPGIEDVVFMTMEFASGTMAHVQMSWLDHDAIEADLGIELDSWYILESDMTSAKPPKHALLDHLVDDAWALHRAHWLAGQYVSLSGAAPTDFVPTPSWEELLGGLRGEVSFIELLVAEHRDDPGHAAYAVLNGCRVLHSAEARNVVVSKWAAGLWALKSLASTWHAPIRAAMRTYDAEATRDDGPLLTESMAPFVAYLRDRLP